MAMAIVDGANLSGAILSNADLTGANLTEASMYKADLTGGLGNRSIQLFVNRRLAAFRKM